MLLYDGKQSAMNFCLNYIQLKLYCISFLKVNYVLQAVKQLTTYRLEDNGQCCAQFKCTVEAVWASWEETCPVNQQLWASISRRKLACGRLKLCRISIRAPRITSLSAGQWACSVLRWELQQTAETVTHVAQCSHHSSSKDTKCRTF